MTAELLPAELQATAPDAVSAVVTRLVGGDAVLDLDLQPAQPGRSPGVLVARDLLVYGADPVAQLAAAAAAHPGARLVAVVPNAAHAALRLALLTGSVPYGGALRPGHQRLLTRTSLLELLARGGWRAAHVHAVDVDPFDTAATGVDVERNELTATAAAGLVDDPEARAAWYVVVAWTGAAAEGAVAQLVALLDVETAVLREQVQVLSSELASAASVLGSLGGVDVVEAHEQVVEARLEVMRLRDALVRHELGQAPSAVELAATQRELDDLRAYHALVVTRMQRMDGIIAPFLDPRVRTVAKRAFVLQGRVRGKLRRLRG